MDLEPIVELPVLSGLLCVCFFAFLCLCCSTVGLLLLRGWFVLRRGAFLLVFSVLFVQ